MTILEVVVMMTKMTKMAMMMMMMVWMMAVARSWGGADCFYIFI